MFGTFVKSKSSDKSDSTLLSQETNDLAMILINIYSYNIYVSLSKAHFHILIIANFMQRCDLLRQFIDINAVVVQTETLFPVPECIRHILANWVKTTLSNFYF